MVIYTHDRGVMNRLEFALYAEMAQMESERLADRTSRGRRAAASRGVIMGDIPYGYRAANETDANGEPLLNSRGYQIRRVEIDPVTGKVVLRANLDFHAGKSPQQIATAFTAEGIPTPEGGPIWHPNTIIGVSRSMSGLLRNPMLIGKIIHGKVRTEYDERTGKVKKFKGDVADQIEHDAPWLRIVPQEVWDRNQERLAARPPSKLRDRRRPTYLLSGITRCGVCGGPFNLVTSKMGCTARRVQACTNSRRVKREDLERVVLEGLSQRLKQADVLQWFIPEYLRERGATKIEGADRYDRSVTRLAEVSREVENLIAQVKAGAKGYAAQLLNDSLETLGAEKERLAREVRAGPPSPPEALTTDRLVERVGVLFRDLGDALNGDERDAARAREILRTLISEVTITPLESDGRRPEGRAVGAVRVQIDGEVSRLVDRAMLDRKVMHRRGAEDVHQLPVATFRMYVDLDRTLSPEQEGLWADAAVVGRMLDDADWPVTFEEMIATFNDRGREPTALEREFDETRARVALAQFRRDDWVRSVRLGQTLRGWVWDDRDVSDAEWVERYERRDELKTPVAVVRVSAPEASVVVIGPGSSTTRT